MLNSEDHGCRFALEKVPHNAMVVPGIGIPSL
jgi:hypothetical protein